MYVLLDIEWITNPPETPNPGYWLTQLSAARIDETWTVLERFDKIIRPIDPVECDWSFMAYNKMKKVTAFNAGCGASASMRRLQAFEMFWHAEGMKTKSTSCLLSVSNKVETNRGICQTRRNGHEEKQRRTYL